MQPCRECHQRVQVAVGGDLEGVNVVVTVVADHDYGQVIVLHQVPGYEGLRDASVPVGEGMNLHEPAVEPSRQQ